VYSKLKEEIPDVTGESVLRAIECLVRIEIVSDSPRRKEITQTLKERVIPTREETQYWMNPVLNERNERAEATIRRLTSENGVNAFGDHTSGSKRIRIGDRICDYVASKGIGAYATVSSLPQKMTHPAVKNSEEYCWVLHLSNPALILDRPRPIDVKIRQSLDAFKGRDAVNWWQWFVQSTTRLTKHDYECLIG
jgi:uroporphyrinogen-III synthase